MLGHDDTGLKDGTKTTIGEVTLLRVTRDQAKAWNLTTGKIVLAEDPDSRRQWPAMVHVDGDDQPKFPKPDPAEARKGIH